MTTETETETNSMDDITNRLADYNVQMLFSAEEARVTLLSLFLIWQHRDEIYMPENDKIHLILIIQKLCTMIAELTSNDPADAPSESGLAVFGIVQQLQVELSESVPELSESVPESVPESETQH